MQRVFFEHYLQSIRHSKLSDTRWFEKAIFLNGINCSMIDLEHGSLNRDGER